MCGPHAKHSADPVQTLFTVQTLYKTQCRHCAGPVQTPYKTQYGSLCLPYVDPVQNTVQTLCGPHTKHSMDHCAYPMWTPYKTVCRLCADLVRTPYKTHYGSVCGTLYKPLSWMYVICMEHFLKYLM